MSLQHLQSPSISSGNQTQITVLPDITRYVSQLRDVWKWIDKGISVGMKTSMILPPCVRGKYINDNIFYCDGVSAHCMYDVHIVPQKSDKSIFKNASGIEYTKKYPFLIVASQKKFPQYFYKSKVPCILYVTYGWYAHHVIKTFKDKQFSICTGSTLSSQYILYKNQKHQLISANPVIDMYDVLFQKGFCYIDYRTPAQVLNYPDTRQRLFTKKKNNTVWNHVKQKHIDSAVIRLKYTAAEDPIIGLVSNFKLCPTKEFYNICNNRENYKQNPIYRWIHQKI